MSKHVKTDRDGRVLSILIDRPDKKNALTHEMYAAIADGLERAHDDDQIRCVILTGAGDSFTAGNDLGDFAAGLPEGKPPVVRFLEAIVACDKPLLAAVNGPAVGVGLTLLLHSDLVYASEQATFRSPFPHLGVVPEAGSSLLLPMAVGNAWANDIFIAGRVLTAQEALSAGLVSRVFPAASFMEECRKIASIVAAQAPNAMRETKRLIRSNRAAVMERMAKEGAIFNAQLKSPEFMLAASAYMQRRLPEFD
ncbi:MAG: enoyl-CoA hydratase [Alphaproteobacteria bacterium RIFCSPHIGHO2_12_FULL_63_12]|nr:MAG: enoyl-CoA hydratase [Alphaproteobacteria bacterium RIFCSPHIGHO2_12_FULL_63_12]